MRLIPLASLIVTLLVAGCRHDKPVLQPQQAPPATVEKARQIQAAYQRAASGVVVGLVSDVNPDLYLAAVSEVAVSDFHPGDVVTFVDSNQNPVTTGSVLRIAGNALHVKYDPPRLAGGRPPKVGDLMVRFMRSR